MSDHFPVSEKLWKRLLHRGDYFQAIYGVRGPFLLWFSWILVDGGPSQTELCPKFLSMIILLDYFLLILNLTL